MNIVLNKVSNHEITKDMEFDIIHLAVIVINGFSDTHLTLNSVDYSTHTLYIVIVLNVSVIHTLSGSIWVIVSLLRVLPNLTINREVDIKKVENIKRRIYIKKVSSDSFFFLHFLFTTYSLLSFSGTFTASLTSVLVLLGIKLACLTRLFRSL